MSEVRTPAEVIANFLGLEEGNYELRFDDDGLLSLHGDVHKTEAGEELSYQVSIPLHSDKRFYVVGAAGGEPHAMVNGDVHPKGFGTKIWEALPFSGCSWQEMELDELGVDPNKFSIVMSALQMAHFDVESGDIQLTGDQLEASGRLATEISEADKATLTVGDRVRISYIEEDGESKVLQGHICEVLVEDDRRIYKIKTKDGNYFQIFESNSGNISLDDPRVTIFDVIVMMSPWGSCASPILEKVEELSKDQTPKLCAMGSSACDDDVVNVYYNVDSGESTGADVIDLNADIVDDDTDAADGG